MERMTSWVVLQTTTGGERWARLDEVRSEDVLNEVDGEDWHWLAVRLTMMSSDVLEMACSDTERGVMWKKSAGTANQDGTSHLVWELLASWAAFEVKD